MRALVLAKFRCVLDYENCLLEKQRGVWGLTSHTMFDCLMLVNVAVVKLTWNVCVRATYVLPHVLHSFCDPLISGSSYSSIWGGPGYQSVITICAECDVPHWVCRLHLV